MILIAYDGSEDAKSAIEQAASLMPGQPAVVLTVWVPYGQILARSTVPFGISAGVQDVTEIDAAALQSAQARAQEGAALARSLGLDASPHTRAREESYAESILAEADRVNASAIVTGSRGLGGGGSLLLGSGS